MLLQASLKQVPHYGWTQQAITAAVMEQPQFTISMAGMIEPYELVEFVMEDWNTQLQAKIQQQQQEQQHPMTEYEAIKFRLSLTIPLIQCGRWHEAMAIGLLQNPTKTQAQLHRIMTLIAPPHASMTYQVGLGTIYVATELHLLTDPSPDYQATWNFLQQRLQELDQPWMAMTTTTTTAATTASTRPFHGTTSSSSLMDLPMTATNAVAMSLWEGMNSLLFPPTSSNAVAGTKSTDYQNKP